LLNVFPQKIKHNVLLLIHYYPSQWNTEGRERLSWPDI
jgi:hypothetical protein